MDEPCQQRPTSDEIVEEMAGLEAQRWRATCLGSPRRFLRPHVRGRQLLLKVGMRGNQLFDPAPPAPAARRRHPAPAAGP